jgi:hypothetical protein
MTLDPTKPLGCINAKLRQLTRRVSQALDHEMGQIGLKATQYSLLSQVCQRGADPSGDLAKAMALDASTSRVRDATRWLRVIGTARPRASRPPPAFEMRRSTCDASSAIAFAKSRDGSDLVATTCESGIWVALQADLAHFVS